MKYRIKWQVRGAKMGGHLTHVFYSREAAEKMAQEANKRFPYVLHTVEAQPTIKKGE